MCSYWKKYLWLHTMTGLGRSSDGENHISSLTTFQFEFSSLAPFKLSGMNCNTPFCVLLDDSNSLDKKAHLTSLHFLIRVLTFSSSIIAMSSPKSLFKSFHFLTMEKN